MTISALLVLGWLTATQAPVPVMPQPVPVPAEAAPPPPPPPPPPPVTDAATPAPSNGKEKEKPEAPKYTFAPGNKEENIVPCTSGDAKVQEGKVEVTAEDNSMKTVLTGGVGANVWLGVHSSALQSFQVTQEFEITCSDDSIKQVVLTLESNLAGFVRAKHKASACVKLASAVIAPVGAAYAPMSVCFPTACVGCGSCEAQGYKYETPQEPIKTAPLPLGQYVLQATFIIEATAGGLLDAHSMAYFVGESEDLDAWEREHDPFKGDAHDDYGFTLTLKADTPPGAPPVAKAKPKKKKKNVTQTAEAPPQQFYMSR